MAGDLLCAITRARTAIDDSMPRECFPEGPDPNHSRMMQARGAADEAMRVFDAEMRKQLSGMDSLQALRSWHSVCARVLFDLECAVAAYER